MFQNLDMAKRQQNSEKELEYGNLKETISAPFVTQ